MPQSGETRLPVSHPRGEKPAGEDWVLAPADARHRAERCARRTIELVARTALLIERSQLSLARSRRNLGPAALSVSFVTAEDMDETQ